MMGLKSLCEYHGVSMSMAVFPRPIHVAWTIKEPGLVKVWAHFADSTDIPFINHYPDFVGKHEDRVEAIGLYYIPGDIHFNELGNRVVAESFLRHLRQVSD